MIDRDLLVRVGREVRNLIPLFRYLILQTETHAFCLALACAALIGFYPTCLVMLSVLKHILRWNAAYDVFIDTVRLYYPRDQDFLIHNLESSLASSRIELGSLVWILLAATGIFVPLETGFNRLWQVRDDRPYWLNQIVGFVLAVGCSMLALVFVAISTSIQFFIDFFPFEILRRGLDYVVIRAVTTCFLIVTICALYKFLPNRSIATRDVLPAAILAGVMAELVRMIYRFVLPFTNLATTQGPFIVSVSFVLLFYFETFVVLGGAFLASRTERYPWMGFLRTKTSGTISH
jgi:YihY family inner membrane protein